jgi:hypothetical protein
MKPLIEKVLKSGLIDKHMAQMLEKWGNLPDGASDLVNDDALKDATREQLTKLGEELGDEVDKLRTLKETQFDIDRMRWPTEVSIKNNGGHQIVYKIPAVIDRMGRLYFRHQDVKADWLTPGFIIARDITSLDNPNQKSLIEEQILESSVLYTDEVPVAFQVSVHRVA